MDKLSPSARSALMSRVRGSNTAPELKLRRAIWRMGIRYRLGQRIGKTRPDIVFKGLRVAVFVDGCFWHSCPLHGTTPKSNQLFWEHKLARNVERDRATTAKLEMAGWQVLRFWEHEVDQQLEACALAIADTLAERRSAKQSVNAH